VHHVDYPAEQLAISRHIDDVGAWRNNRVPEQCRVLAKKRHYIIINE